jgi:hypothetical protein
MNLGTTWADDEQPPTWLDIERSSVRHRRRTGNHWILQLWNGPNPNGHVYRIGKATRGDEGYSFCSEVNYCRDATARTMEQLKATIFKELDWRKYAPFKEEQADRRAKKVLTRHANLLTIIKGGRG